MGELRDVSDPAGRLASDAVKGLDAWLAATPGRTHDVEGDRHVLRELGILVASNPDLPAALATAERAERRR
jgi:hypothetical protein